MKRQRPRRANTSGAPTPSDFCELFPPEFRHACDPYCWACGPTGHDPGVSPHAAVAHPHHDFELNPHGAHLEIPHDPEDVDLHPYFWDLKQEICPCP